MYITIEVLEKWPFLHLLCRNSVFRRPQTDRKFDKVLANFVQVCPLTQETLNIFHGLAEHLSIMYFCCLNVCVCACGVRVCRTCVSVPVEDVCECVRACVFVLVVFVTNMCACL